MWCPDVDEVGAVVRAERHLREPSGEVGVGATEAGFQLVGQLRTIVVGHDHGCHRTGPPEVVAVQGVEELGDVVVGEPADVGPVVHVARRRTDQHELGEAVRLLDRSEDTDHRRHRVTDEHDITEVQIGADLEHVSGIAVERGVPVDVVRVPSGRTRTGMIEEDDGEVTLEPWRDEPPHLLIAAEPVGEHDRASGRVPRDLDVETIDGGHPRNLSATRRAAASAGRARSVPEQAKGVLAERFALDMAASFESLRRYCRNNNLRLAEVAAAIVDRSLDPSIVRGS